MAWRKPTQCPCPLPDAAAVLALSKQHKLEGKLHFLILFFATSCKSIIVSKEERNAWTFRPTLVEIEMKAKLYLVHGLQKP